MPSSLDSKLGSVGMYPLPPLTGWQLLASTLLRLARLKADCQYIVFSSNSETNIVNIY